MADVKISNLPADTPPLTGAELLECVQSAVNVQTNVSALAATPFSILGAPIGPLTASLQNQFIWITGTPIIPGGGFLQAATNVTATSQQWQRNFSSSASQSLTGAGVNLAGSVQWSSFSTGAAANSPAESYLPVGYGGVQSNPAAVPMIRAASNGLPIAGFTMTAYLVFTAVIANEQVFMGYSSAPGGLSGSQTPSALANAIGLSRDTGDANLQFLITNASGGVTKNSLGVTLASLANHLLKLVITCDGVGNCSITLTDLEANGLSYSISYPTATANLPSPSTGPGINWLIPRLYINNGGSAANCTYAVNQIYFTVGFGN